MVAWSLVFHIVGLIFWLGSLLVVTQVLAIHTEESFPDTRAALARVETKLLRGLAHPGAAIMVISGVVLVALEPYLLHQHWLQVKLALVVVLIALDLRLTLRTRAFHDGKIELGRRECMVLHGAISLVFLGILVLAMIRPFGVGSRHLRLGGRNVPTASAYLASLR